MEELKKGNKLAENALSTIFADIAASWERELESQKRAFAQERQEFINEVAELKLKASVAENLATENEQLRNKLKSTHNISHEVHESFLPHQSKDGRCAVFADDTNEKIIPSDSCKGVIAYDEYERVRNKCEAALRQLELQKLQGGQYKLAYTKLTHKHNQYKEKFEQCKASIKSWQDFADKILDRSKSLSGDEGVNINTPHASRARYYRSPAWPMSSNHSRGSLTPRRTPAKSSRSTISPQRSGNLRPQPSAYHDVAQVEWIPNPSHNNLTERTDMLNSNTKQQTKNENSEVVVISTTDAVYTATEHRNEQAQNEEWKNGFTKTTKTASPKVDDISPIPLSEETSIKRTFKKLKELPSSQATEEEEELTHRSAPLMLHQNDFDDDDDDEPTVVSIRDLKRKRQPGARVLASTGPIEVVHPINGSSKKPFTIKHEDSHDSLLGLAGILCQEHSLDLDEVPSDVDTPRKRRLRRMLSSESRSGLTNDSYHTRAASVPIEIESLEQHLDNSFEAEIAEHSSRSHESILHGAYAEYAYAVANSELPAPHTLTLLSPDRVMDKKNPLDKINVLQPINVNRRILPRVSNVKTRLSSKIRQQLAPIRDITEDGEEFDLEHSKSSPLTKNGALGLSKTPKLTDSRIEALLDTSTFDRQVLSMQGCMKRSKDNKSIKDSLVFEMKTHETGITPAQTHKPSSPNSTNSTKSWLKDNSPAKKYSVKPSRLVGQVERDGDQIRKKEEPLRARPVEKLNLDDFKINPKFNQGLNFAFSEVVRNQEQRRCLPGCTRPECCGNQFRRMVQLGGDLPVPARGLWDSSPSEDGNNDDDQRILEVFLGDDCARLSHMTSEKKAELLLTAKAEQLARKHGKHRQAFDRSTTPPGFWRTDMPTTQETEEDRKRLREVEREKVEERYFEARKTDGRWLFRDE